MKKYDIEIIGTMLVMILVLVGAIFGWCWQVVLPIYALFIVPTMAYILLGSVKYGKRIKH